MVDPPRVIRRVSLIRVTVGVAVAVLLLDQLSKFLAVEYLEGRTPVELLGPILRLNFVRNPGAAFSLGAGFTIVFSLIALGVVFVIVRTARTLGSTGWAVALGLLLGGAIGNLIDRLFRDPGLLRGHVVDFLQLPHWPVFNVADSAIVVGAVLMMLLTLRGVSMKGAPPSAGSTP